MKKVIMFILVAVFVITGSAYFYIKGTPRYSLYQFRKAIMNHDAETALQYLDIDSIVDNLVKDLPIMEEKTPQNEWEAAGQGLGRGMLMMMIPAMKEGLKSNLKSSIASNDDKTQFSRLKDGSMWDFVITVDGKSAVISPKGEPNVKFRMSKSTAGHWKIIEIINETERKQDRHQGDG